MSDLKQNERGHTLVLIIIFMAVFAVLGVAMYSYSINQRKSALVHGRNIEAYYVARSGAEAVKARLIQPDVDVASYIDTIVDGDIDGKEFSVDISKDEDDLVLASTGKVPSGSSTLEETAVMVIPGGVDNSGVSLDMAVFSEGLITINGGFDTNTIQDGDIGTSGDHYIINGSQESGTEVNVSVNKSYDDVLFPSFPNINVTGESLIVPNKSSYTISESSRYSSISLGNNESTLYIDLSSGDIDIVVDDFNFSGQDVIILGSDMGNKLNLYVKNSFDMGNNSSLTNSSKENFTLYYDGGEAISLPSDAFSGNIYISKADLSTSNGKNYDLNIYSNGSNLDIAGGVTFSGIIYAPNAAVTIGGNASITGAIVGSSFILSGDATVKYYVPDDSGWVDIPIDTSFYDFDSAYWRD